MLKKYQRVAGVFARKEGKKVCIYRPGDIIIAEESALRVKDPQLKYWVEVKEPIDTGIVTPEINKPNSVYEGTPTGNGSDEQKDENKQEDTNTGPISISDDIKKARVRQKPGSADNIINQELVIKPRKDKKFDVVNKNTGVAINSAPLSEREDAQALLDSVVGKQED